MIMGEIVLKERIDKFRNIAHERGIVKFLDN